MGSKVAIAWCVCLPRNAVFSRNAQTFLLPLWKKVVSGIYCLKINELYSFPMLRANYRSGGTDSLKLQVRNAQLQPATHRKTFGSNWPCGSQSQIVRSQRSLPAQALF